MSVIAVKDAPKWQVNDVIAIRVPSHWFWRRILAPGIARFSLRLALRLCWRWAEGRVTFATGDFLTVEWKP